jgi:hypothetical protein
MANTKPVAPHQHGELEQSASLNVESLLKENDIETIASMILEDTFRDTDILRKDFLDKFLDYVIFKAQTGSVHIEHMAYPCRRMIDTEMEAKAIILINDHLYPEVVLRLLKYFLRNRHDSDSNLYLANLITSEDIIRGIYDTFNLLKNDIFITNPDKRSMNVKRIQQVSPRTENKTASPLDAVCRLKYILEFILIKLHVEHIYTAEDLQLSKIAGRGRIGR